MNSLNNTLMNIYNNLYTFFDYRCLIPLDDQIKDDQFIKYIYNNNYIIINTIYKKYIKNEEERKEIKENINNIKYKNLKNYKITYVVVFHHSTDIYTKTPEFKKIINSLSKTNMLYDIIIITKNTLSTHVNNYIKTINNKEYKIEGKKCIFGHNEKFCNCFKSNIYSYTYNLFTIIIPNHILSNKHEILANEESESLLNNILFCKKINLPKIKIYDPQIIWSCGTIGDIVKITRNNDVTGLSYYYRLIIS